MRNIWGVRSLSCHKIFDKTWHYNKICLEEVYTYEFGEIGASQIFVV